MQSGMTVIFYLFIHKSTSSSLFQFQAKTFLDWKIKALIDIQDDLLISFTEWVMRVWLRPALSSVSPAAEDDGINLHRALSEPGPEKQVG